ncbi:MAG TPA: HlyD family efflux transporter periplasmic adaptor subunit, partial [Xanthomonadaceae bacterium]|nr:HlyD family efflux transporter periplasmic adaptor subunit [Xanthomonadaceae bacterium]
EVVPSWEGRRARLFRAEALADRDDDIRLLPLQLLLAPSWTRRGVQVLAAGLALLVIALFVPVRDRFGTSASLGLDGVVSISATAPGRIQSLTAIPGQHVAASAPLARLSDTAAAAEAERAYADYVALLRRRLAHADAAAADPELAQAWERLQQARTAALPQLRAPGPGRILDLSVSRGQEVVAGQSLMQFAPDGGAAQLDLDLPGRAATELHAGATGSARLASMPDREFPIRVAWVAQTVASAAAGTNAARPAAGMDQTEPHVHARAVFTGEQPQVFPGTRADVRVDLGSKPLSRLLYQRWMED